MPNSSLPSGLNYILYIYYAEWIPNIVFTGVKVQPSTFNSGLYSSSLVIKNITKEMSGIYQCQKTFHDNITYSESIHLQILGINI